MRPEYYQHLLSQVKYGPQDSDRHVLTCFSMAMQIHAKKILELGVRTGNTTLPFLCAAKELGGMVHSVDLDATTFQCPDDLRVYWKFFQSDAIAWLEQQSEGVLLSSKCDLMDCVGCTKCGLSNLMRRPFQFHPN